jgi:hypothetical protein
MPKFEIIYSSGRTNLDTVIEADTFKIDAKFISFITDKEVVRMIQVGAIFQVKRLDE